MSDFDWKKFDLNKWWKALTGAGIAIALAAIAAKFPPALFIGLGVMFFGIGEWYQHPTQTLPAGSFGLPPGTVTTNERNVTILGIAFNVLGLALFAVGLVKLLLA